MAEVLSAVARKRLLLRHECSPSSDAASTASSTILPSSSTAASYGITSLLCDPLLATASSCLPTVLTTSALVSLLTPSAGAWRLGARCEVALVAQRDNREALAATGA